MVTRAYGDTLVVKNGANVVRVDAGELERQYAGLIACGTDETQTGQL
jgi:hypothetical protein